MQIVESFVLNRSSICFVFFVRDLFILVGWFAAWRLPMIIEDIHCRVCAILHACGIGWRSRLTFGQWMVKRDTGGRYVQNLEYLLKYFNLTYWAAVCLCNCICYFILGSIWTILFSTSFNFSISFGLAK